jgi:hypothetical protein
LTKEEEEAEKAFLQKLYDEMAPAVAPIIRNLDHTEDDTATN